jgi:hypothetical protein
MMRELEYVGNVRSHQEYGCVRDPLKPRGPTDVCTRCDPNDLRATGMVYETGKRIRSVSELH